MEDPADEIFDLQVYFEMGSYTVQFHPTQLYRLPRSYQGALAAFRRQELQRFGRTSRNLREIRSTLSYNQYREQAPRLVSRSEISPEAIWVVPNPPLGRPMMNVAITDMLLANGPPWRLWASGRRQHEGYFFVLGPLTHEEIVALHTDYFPLSLCKYGIVGDCFQTGTFGHLLDNARTKALGASTQGHGTRYQEDLNLDVGQYHGESSTQGHHRAGPPRRPDRLLGSTGGHSFGNDFGCRSDRFSRGGHDFNDRGSHHTGNRPHRGSTRPHPPQDHYYEGDPGPSTGGRRPRSSTMPSSRSTALTTTQANSSTTRRNQSQGPPTETVDDDDFSDGFGDDDGDFAGATGNTPPPDYSTLVPTSAQPASVQPNRPIRETRHGEKQPRTGL